jgi:predicted secreted protein
MNGNLILISAVKSSTNIIAAAKSGEIQTDCETIEISNQSQSDWRNYIAGRKTWSVNVNYLVLAAADIRKVLNVGTTYTITIKNRANTTSMTGDATLVSCKQTYTKGNLVAGSFQFRGTGPLQ